MKMCVQHVCVCTLKNTCRHEGHLKMGQSRTLLGAWQLQEFLKDTGMEGWRDEGMTAGHSETTGCTCRVEHLSPAELPVVVALGGDVPSLPPCTDPLQGAG